MAIARPYYPIIYVRGYAATMTEIEDTVASPYMGLELGSTKLRQSWEGKPMRHIFESPLVRLMKDEEYRDTFVGGDLVPQGERIESQSIWIFRYYEQASEDLGSGRRQTPPEIAADLRRFVLRIRQHVCQDDAAARAAFRVYLVAHSMGGLVCRAYLQNLCRHGAAGLGLEGDAAKALNKELELTRAPGEGLVPDSVHLVDKVFTYATPHNGIDLAGMNSPDFGSFDPVHVRNFNREYMHGYLKISGEYKDGQSVATLDGAFPTQRFFCLVGSNWRDYSAFFGLSKKAAGEMSDGLVKIGNATVAGAPRAFCHRSHSGHYGIVNSEEGYQNLRRFLFGDVEVEARLLCEEITLPKKVQAAKDAGKEIRASYHVETSASVRGLLCLLHERKVEHASALLGKYDELVKEAEPLYLFTGYLSKAARGPSLGRGKELAFAIRLALRVPTYEVDNKLWFDGHFEGGSVFDETVTFHLKPDEKAGGAAGVMYGLQSLHGIGEAPVRPTEITASDGTRRFDVALGFAPELEPAQKPMPGFRGVLQLTARPWNA